MLWKTICCSLLAGFLLLTPALAQSEDKATLTSLDQLPKRTYALPCKVDEFSRSPEALRLLSSKLQENLTEDLKQYTFATPAVEREFYSRGLQIHMALDAYEEALNDIQAMRRLTDKEALTYMSALHAEAWVRARLAVGKAADAEALHAAYGKQLQELVNRLPWAIVRQELTRKQATLRMTTEEMVRLMLKRLEAQPGAGGRLDEESAYTLVGMCNALEIIIPHKDLTADIYGEFLAKGQNQGTPLMTARQQALAIQDPGKPVVIAIWDTGVDVEIFADQLLVNTGESADGLDTDGNGFVDDLHGIAFGPDLQPTQGLLMPHDFSTEAMAELQTQLQGMDDLQANHATEEADQQYKLLLSLGPKEKQELRTKILFCDLYCHGTHVTGIATHGNPFARVLTVRVTFDDKALKTREWARAFVAMCRKSVAYFKARGVRVVNMSWGWDVHEIAANLTDHQVGAGAEERTALAEEIFAVLELGLYQALASAPEILFVNGAGDAPGDPALYRWIPGLFDLPNVVPVGAVDAHGELTSFSAHGNHVRLLGYGLNVESFVPGGNRLRLSGTSMAAPQVTNLAAKLIALDPTLTPEQTIRLMLDGGETVERAGRQQVLLNPRRSLELLAGVKDR